MAKSMTLPDEIIISKIYLIRNRKVMLDRDLAELYGVETKVLKQAVRRNLPRFPEDFMFEMKKSEFDSWRKENITSTEDKKGLRYFPFCFTEQGVTMLSCILNSSIAIEVNLKIIRIFTKLRETILTHKEILLKLEQLERNVNRHDGDIKLIFECLKQLLDPKAGPVKRIGFKRSDEE